MPLTFAKAVQTNLKPSSQNRPNAAPERSTSSTQSYSNAFPPSMLQRFSQGTPPSRSGSLSADAQLEAALTHHIRTIFGYPSSQNHHSYHSRNNQETMELMGDGRGMPVVKVPQWPEFAARFLLHLSKGIWMGVGIVTMDYLLESGILKYFITRERS